MQQRMHMHWLGPDVPVFDPNFTYNHHRPYLYDDDLFPNDAVSARRHDAVSAHHHDGTSPLPLGMDWSPPPRLWEGRSTVWPRHPPTGWSFCVTLPSWVTAPQSPPSDPVAVSIYNNNSITLPFYRFSSYLPF